MGQAEGDWTGGLGPDGRILNVLYGVQMSATTNSGESGTGAYLFFFFFARFILVVGRNQPGGRQSWGELSVCSRSVERQC